MPSRGNYRQRIIAEERAKRLFEATLFEACARARWVLHASCVMGDHLHLAVEAPAGNLTSGILWLQSMCATG